MASPSRDSSPPTSDRELAVSGAPPPALAARSWSAFGLHFTSPPVRRGISSRLQREHQEEPMNDEAGRRTAVDQRASRGWGCPLRNAKSSAAADPVDAAVRRFHQERAELLIGAGNDKEFHF